MKTYRLILFILLSTLLGCTRSFHIPADPIVPTKEFINYEMYKYCYLYEIIQRSREYYYVFGGEELIIPHDDGSISKKPITCMYIGYKNKISYSHHGSQIIKITTNNGRVIKDTTFHIVNYYIIPDNNSDIKVDAIIALRRNQAWDTIQVSGSFSSLNPPKVRITVDKDLFRNKKRILLSLVDSSTGLQISSRYKIGRLGYVKVFDKKHNKTGNMDLFNEEIDFSQWHHFSDNIIKSGYTIEPFFCIRDTITDLLSDTEPFSYKIK